MSWLIPSLAFVFAGLSATAFYAGRSHCRWTALQRVRRSGNALGLAFALASLTLWIADLGAGAGLCAMLANWMLLAMLLPYLALLSGAVPDLGEER